MAGFGWHPANAGPGIDVAAGALTASRATDGGGGTYAALRGNAGRTRGKRYFEVDASSVGCAVGFVSVTADLDDQLGGGSTASQWGFLLSNGYLYYRDEIESASFNTGTGAVSASIIGVLLDFDAHSVTFYSDGELLFSRSVVFTEGMTIYPAAHLDVGAADVELVTVEPFNYAPDLTFVDWDKSDKAIGSRVSGTLEVEGSPASRLVKAFTYDRIPFSINNKPIKESKPLGQSLSDTFTGEYEIQLRDGYNGEVIVFAFDNYGEAFDADVSVGIGDRIHPTTPSGYVYECTGGGTLPSTEPDPWPTDTEASHLIGTASFDVKPFYRPEAHGPIVPEFVEVDGDADAFGFVASAYNHGLAINVDGTVTGWGSNTYGRATPPVGLDGVLQVEASNECSYALKTDGTVVAWGNSYGGQLNVPSGLNNAIQISAGYNWCLAVKADGTVVAWGNNDSGQVSGVASLSNVKQAAAGRTWGIALMHDGTTAHWGYDYAGLATGIASMGSDIIQVAAARADYHCLALRADGTVTSAGINNYGQRNIPGGLSNVVQVSAGNGYSYALISGGGLSGWGRNNQGQISTPGGLPPLVHISSAYLTSVGVDAGGNAFFWGLSVGSVPAGLNLLLPNLPQA
ncbi:MAG: hypothetical protein P1U47_05380 [Zhongshania sp.]|uniref:SPRY domain-containing protein n=1 Tax=Zhongshania sp. TaxID=1971902 RepID=UPI00261C4E85|nr:SPRY domain-containing protein [Zhongshania sp.]MDF1691780.1 hypothetical protein [Zhongshania sp.]